MSQEQVGQCTQLLVVDAASDCGIVQLTTRSKEAQIVEEAESLMSSHGIVQVRDPPVPASGAWLLWRKAICRRRKKLIL